MTKSQEHETKSKEHERPNFTRLRVAAKSACALATELFSNDVTGVCSEIRYARACGKDADATDGCLERETKRLKGHPKLPDGSTLRSYSYFDPHKLCNSCAAYWYAELGAQELARIVTLERMVAAEEGRNLPGDGHGLGCTCTDAQLAGGCRAPTCRAAQS